MDWHVPLPTTDGLFMRYVWIYLSYSSEVYKPLFSTQHQKCRISLYVLLFDILGFAPGVPLPTIDFSGELTIDCPLMAASLSTPLAIADTFSVALAAFFGSACPMTGTLDANHCWKGFATKYPSASNQRVNGADISSVFQTPEDAE